MADKNLTSGITAAGALTGSELVHVVQSGNSRKATVAALRSPLAAGVSLTSDLTGQNYSAATVISWNTEDFDDAGFWAVGSPTRLTVPTGVSRVRVEACASLLELTAASNLLVHLEIRKNGSAIASMILLAGNRGQFAGSVTSGTIEVTPGDYFEMAVRSADDSSVTLLAAQTRFTIAAK